MLGLDEAWRALNKEDLGRPSSEIGSKGRTILSSSKACSSLQEERDLFPHSGDSSHNCTVNENEVCALSMERDLVTTCIIIIDEALVEEALQFPSLFVPFLLLLGVLSSRLLLLLLYLFPRSRWMKPQGCWFHGRIRVGLLWEEW